MAKKLAIIGYGGMGGWHHKCIQTNIPQIRVTGAYDIRKEAMDKAAENGLHAYESLTVLLNDPDIDIVTIATPNDVHKDISIAALRAGKHVICEKPVTMNAAELEEIIPIAQKCGKIFSIHQNRRWDRDFLTAKKIISDGVIGSPYYIETRVQGSRRSMHGWRGYRVNGGGMVLDWGIHLLDQLLFLLESPVISVDTHLLKIFSNEVDDNFKVFLRFENGISALVEIATNCLIEQPRWHISCDVGTAVIKNFSCEGEMVKLISDGEMGWEDEVIYTAAGPTRTMAPRPKHTIQVLSLPEITEGYSDWEKNTSPYYDNIAEVLEGKAELIVKPEQALRVMKLVDTIFRCAEQGHGGACRI